MELELKRRLLAGLSVIDRTGMSRNYKFVQIEQNSRRTPQGFAWMCWDRRKAGGGKGLGAVSAVRSGPAREKRNEGRGSAGARREAANSRADTAEEKFATFRCVDCGDCGDCVCVYGLYVGEYEETRRSDTDRRQRTRRGERGGGGSRGQGQHKEILQAQAGQGRSSHHVSSPFDCDDSLV